MELHNQLTSGEIAERIANLKAEIDAVESQVKELQAKAVEQSLDEEAHRLTHEAIAATGPTRAYKFAHLTDLKVLHDRVVEEERLERLVRLREQEGAATALLKNDTPIVRDLLHKEDHRHRNAMIDLQSRIQDTSGEEDRHRKTIIELKSRILTAERESCQARLDLLAAEAEDYRITGVAGADVKHLNSRQAILEHYDQSDLDVRIRFNEVERRLIRLTAPDLPISELGGV